MFDSMKNLGSLAGLLTQAGKMKEKMQAMQDVLAKKEITAEAGGGLARATVNGKLELISIRLDQSKGDITNTANLEDVITAAVRAAQAQAATYMKQELQKAASEAGLPPGLLG